MVTEGLKCFEEFPNRSFLALALLPELVFLGIIWRSGTYILLRTPITSVMSINTIRKSCGRSLSWTGKLLAV